MARPYHYSISFFFTSSKRYHYNIAKWPDHLKFTTEWPAHACEYTSVLEEPLEMEGGEPQETEGSW